MVNTAPSPRAWTRPGPRAVRRPVWIAPPDTLPESVREPMPVAPRAVVRHGRYHQGTARHAGTTSSPRWCRSFLATWQMSWRAFPKVGRPSHLLPWRSIDRTRGVRCCPVLPVLPWFRGRDPFRRQRRPDTCPPTAPRGSYRTGSCQLDQVPRRGIPPPLRSAFVVSRDLGGLPLSGPSDMFQKVTLVGFGYRWDSLPEDRSHPTRRQGPL